MVKLRLSGKEIFKTVSISQTELYLGLGRRILKAPAINVGCYPIGLLSVCTWQADIPDMWEFIELYSYPS